MNTRNNNNVYMCTCMYICVIYSDIYLHMYKNLREDKLKKDEPFFYPVTLFSKLKIHFWEQTSVGTLNSVDVTCLVNLEMSSNDYKS